jgi:Ca2+-binding EF-hand superfamily protein
MNSVEVEAQIINIILSISKAEQGVERLRQVLSQKPLYEPYAAFQRIDRKYGGYITVKSLQEFLLYFLYED